MATFKALLIKRDTSPLTYDLHTRTAANWAEARTLSANFALVHTGGMESHAL